MRLLEARNFPCHGSCCRRICSSCDGALEGASELGTDGWLSREPVGAEGLPTSKRRHTLNALTCAFAPLARLEPAPYGLEVSHDPSS